LFFTAFRHRLPDSAVEGARSEKEVNGMGIGALVRQLANLLRDEEGQGMVEYGLIIALVAIVVIAVLTAMGGSIQGIFQQIVDTLSPSSP